MKIFHSEFLQNYDTYTFGYAVYAQREEGDRPSELYEKGFLPYSGSEESVDLFYEARSLRIALKNFSLNSENRRIAKRFEGAFEKQIIPIRAFNAKDPEFLKFCLAYFSKRHGARIMPIQRLELILKAPILKHIISYTKNGMALAYVLDAGDEAITHFWYSFYDLSLVQQSLGLYLMIDECVRAKNEGKEYFYLGTVYGEKGLYKSNFNCLEFWNGTRWVNDRRALRKRGKSDTERTSKGMDEWKSQRKNFF